MIMTSFLRFHDLTKSYYEGSVRHIVLQKARAEFQPGEITAILGKSGSGKSTLLNLISGIDMPDSGEIWVDGTNLTALSERDRTLFRRARIGFVFQFFNLIPTLTVGENVSLPLELNHVPRTGAKKKAQGLLDAVGLLDRWDTFPEKLSGGEQQRVSLARALVHNPLLILADEPTGNLDEETGAQMMSLLATLTHEQNGTLLVVTHSPEAASYADRILHLSHGHLVADSVNMLSLRTLLRHPLQFSIMILGIALGVAVMVSIDLANVSAARAFDISASTVTGRATHIIIGSGQGLDESVYVRLRTDPQWRAELESAPIVRAYAISSQLGKVPFTLLGIDPFAEGPFRNYLSGQDPLKTESVLSLLTVPGSILLSRSTAQKYGLKPCSPNRLNDFCRLVLSVNGETHIAYLTGLLEPNDDFSRRASDTLIITDISTAQDFSDMDGQLTQIDLILPDNFDARSLASTLPVGTRLVTSEIRNAQVTNMISAFQINLTALSLLALVVGVFLIYNSMTFSVIQRRALFGTLRSIGYTREQVFGMVIGEAAVVGVLGAGLGLGVGILLGQGAVRMVTQTINDLYFVISVRGFQIPSSSLIKGGIVGLFASVLAAAPPAWEAASVPPRQALLRAGLESKVHEIVKRVAWLGMVIAVTGAIILAIPTRNLVISFSGTSAVLLGLAALTPLVTSDPHALVGCSAWQAVWLAGSSGTAQCDSVAESDSGSCRSTYDRRFSHDWCTGDDRQFSHHGYTLVGSNLTWRCLHLRPGCERHAPGYPAGRSSCYHRGSVSPCKIQD